MRKIVEPSVGSICFPIIFAEIAINTNAFGYSPADTSCTDISSVDESVVHRDEGSDATDERVSRSKAEGPPADSLEDCRCWIHLRLDIDLHLKSLNYKKNPCWIFGLELFAVYRAIWEQVQPVLWRRMCNDNYTVVFRVR